MASQQRDCAMLGNSNTLNYHATSAQQAFPTLMLISSISVHGQYFGASFYLAGSLSFRQVPILAYLWGLICFPVFSDRHKRSVSILWMLPHTVSHVEAQTCSLGSATADVCGEKWLGTWRRPLSHTASGNNNDLLPHGVSLVGIIAMCLTNPGW